MQWLKEAMSPVCISDMEWAILRERSVLWPHINFLYFVNACEDFVIKKSDHMKGWYNYNILDC